MLERARGNELQRVGDAGVLGEARVVVVYMAAVLVEIVLHVNVGVVDELV